MLQSLHVVVHKILSNTQKYIIGKISSFCTDVSLFNKIGFKKPIMSHKLSRIHKSLVLNLVNLMNVQLVRVDSR